jgi:hypothetical protein
MARRLGIGRAWVEANIDARFQCDSDGRFSEECWQDLLRKHIAFMRIPALGHGSTLNEAAEQLVCRRGYLLKLIEFHRLAPVKTYRTLTNRKVQGVPARTLRALKRLLPAYAPDGWVTITALHLETGWDYERVRRHLLAAGIQPISYRCAANGHVADHYNRARAVAILGFKPQHVQPAGSHLTLTAIDRLLERGKGWSLRHLTSPIEKATARIMLDDSGSPRRHYPSSVYVRLKCESDQARIRQAA